MVLSHYSHWQYCLHTRKGAPKPSKREADFIVVINCSSAYENCCAPNTQQLLFFFVSARGRREKASKKDSKVRDLAQGLEQHLLAHCGITIIKKRART